MKRETEARARVDDGSEVGPEQRPELGLIGSQGTLPDERASIALLAVANRQTRRAADSIRSGKPSGEGQDWRIPFKVSIASEEDAKQSALLGCLQELTRIYGEDWANRVPWLPLFGPGNRKQVAFHCWLSLVAWRAAYRELATLPGGVTGRREAGTYWLCVDFEQDEAQKAMQLAQSEFDSDSVDTREPEPSLESKGIRARELRSAKRIVWARFLSPFKGKRQLHANQRRAKLAAIRRARIVCQLLDGHRCSMQSSKLSPILKSLGVEISNGRRSLAAELRANPPSGPFADSPSTTDAACQSGTDRAGYKRATQVSPNSIHQTKSPTMKDAYEVVTNKLIEIMESGQIPWRRQWNSVYKDGPPMNATSENKYRGSNIFLLSLAPFSCNRWVTFKQAKSMGGKVRKGQKAWPVVFWRFFEKKGKDGKPVLDTLGKPEKIPMLRYYMVFNLEQCDGIEIPKNEDYNLIDFTPISRCEGVLRGMPQRPQISHGHSGACYLPAQDRVEMPEKNTFTTEEAYYETTFHELAHATGHK